MSVFSVRASVAEILANHLTMSLVEPLVLSELKRPQVILNPLQPTTETEATVEQLPLLAAGPAVAASA